MSWKGQRRQPSFNGREFEWSRSEREVGRRASSSSLPYRDDPVTQDTGRAKRLGSIDGYVIGADYLQQLDALVVEWEKRGAATLVHPYYGKLQVQLLQTVNPVITSDEGGMASFTLHYLNVGGAAKAEKPDTLGPLLGAAGAARSALSAATGSGLSVDGFQSSVRDAAKALLSGPRGAIAAMQGAKGAASSAIGAIDEVARTIELFEKELDDLLSLPGLLAGKLQNVMRKLLGLAPDSDLGPRHATKVALAQLAHTSGVEGVTTSTATPTRQREADNQVTLITLIRGSGAVEATAALAPVRFDSRSQALEVLEALEDALNNAAEGSADDDVFIALKALGAGARQHFTQAAAQLPTVTTFTPAGPIPALVLAHRLYGDASRDADIVARNNLPDPGFVAGGVALEVLSA